VKKSILSNFKMPLPIDRPQLSAPKELTNEPINESGIEGSIDQPNKLDQSNELDQSTQIEKPELSEPISNIDQSSSASTDF